MRNFMISVATVLVMLGLVFFGVSTWWERTVGHRDFSNPDVLPVVTVEPTQPGPLGDGGTPQPTDAPTQPPVAEPTEVPEGEQTLEPAELPTALPEESDDQTVLVTGDLDPARTEDPQDAARLGDVRNILLVGLDKRPGETVGRSDTMMILTLDNTNRCMKLTSLLRDMYVTIPDHGKTRINAAYVYGGAPLLLDTIEYNFGLRIDEYISVDFEALVDVVDQLGGVVMDVPSGLVRGINVSIYEYNSTHNRAQSADLVEAGDGQRLNGVQVQAYARCRQFTSDGDFGRTERQREVIERLIETAAQQSIPTLTKMAWDNLDKIETSLSITDIIGLIPMALDLKDSQLMQLRIPADDAYHDQIISGMAVLVPNLDRCTQDLYDFLAAAPSGESD